MPRHTHGPPPATHFFFQIPQQLYSPFQTIIPFYHRDDTNKMTDAHVEEQVGLVAPNAEKWAKLPDTAKLEYLKDAQSNLERLCDDWAKACLESRHYKGDALMGTAYTMGPVVTGQHIATMINTYESLVKTGKPPAAKSLRKVGDQHVANVYPLSFLDKVLLPLNVDLWIAPGKEATQGACRSRTGVCAILSAGNYEAPIDILHKMFVESKVAVYARHGNLEGSNAFVEKIFHKLVADGYLSIVKPGIPHAQALVHHEKVDEMLMTGGCATYDKIVWGDEKAKETGKKILTKPCEAELGAVSPYVIVPSDHWTDKQLEHHANALVGFKLMNSSAVCASPQLLLVSKQWKHREQFLSLVLKKMEQTDKLPIFYGGTQDRVEAAAKAYEESGRGKVHRIRGSNAPNDEFLRPVVVSGLDEQDLGSFSTRNEAFAPVLVELQVDAADEETFLKRVAEITNSDQVFGSLSCSVIVHDKTKKELGNEAFDKWLKSMEWGTVGVNHWGGMGPIMATGLWGAYPKHTAKDIQSGVGILGNYLMFDHPQKQVCL